MTIKHLERRQCDRDGVSTMNQDTTGLGKLRSTPGSGASATWESFRIYAPRATSRSVNGGSRAMTPISVYFEQTQ
jgi:hypothetical protein